MRVRARREAGAAASERSEGARPGRRELLASGGAKEIASLLIHAEMQVNRRSSSWLNVRFAPKADAVTSGYFLQ